MAKKQITPPRSMVCLCVLAVVIPLGLAVRFAPLHLTWFWSKYLGSALWAAAVYWCVALVLPGQRPRTLACIASAIALVVEFSRLVPEPHIDAFRLTLAGRLLLGRYFAWANIAAYLLAIALAAVADRQLFRRTSDSTK